MAGDKSKPQHHILPLKTYLIVGAVLLVLTGITVSVAQINLGPYNLVVALTIATIKAVLVAFFFMHLLYDNKLYLFIYTSALFFLGIFIIFTLFDTMRRGDLYQDVAAPIEEKAIIYETIPVDTTEIHQTGDY